MVRALDHDQLPAETTSEPPERRSRRVALTWLGAVAGLAAAVVLAVIVLAGGGESTTPQPVFTEHARIHATENVQNSIGDLTPDGVFTEHARIHAADVAAQD